MEEEMAKITESWAKEGGRACSFWIIIQGLAVRRQQRQDPRLGQLPKVDGAWSDLVKTMDPTRGLGGSPSAREGYKNGPQAQRAVPCSSGPGN